MLYHAKFLPDQCILSPIWFEEVDPRSTVTCKISPYGAKNYKFDQFSNVGVLLYPPLDRSGPNLACYNIHLHAKFQRRSVLFLHLQNIFASDA